jgi:hypothetical protein
MKRQREYKEVYRDFWHTVKEDESKESIAS